MARVVIEDLVKVYPQKNGPDVRAVRGINLTVADGEFMVLVGPSGCGKSTTLRMIAGLEEISGGRISIDDRLVNDVAPKDRDIAMVFQNYALYPHLSVYDNLAFSLKLRQVPKREIDERVRSAAALLGLEALLGRKPRALSGGQRQRVAVAGPWSGSRRCSFLTNRCRTWTPRCAGRCGPSSPSCTPGSAPP